MAIYLQVWRLRAAERSRLARQMRVNAEHLRVTADSQLFGCWTKGTDSIEFLLEVGRVLSVAIELGTVERGLQTACSLVEVL